VGRPLSAWPTDFELEALIAVVETGSERAAAQRLGLTQHGVHKRIATLRRRLEVSVI
jgi:DNA-binding transcriptional LysR family regulator